MGTQRVLREIGPSRTGPETVISVNRRLNALPCGRLTLGRRTARVIARKSVLVSISTRINYPTIRIPNEFSFS